MSNLVYLKPLRAVDSGQLIYFETRKYYQIFHCLSCDSDFKLYLLSLCLKPNELNFTNLKCRLILIKHSLAEIRYNTEMQ